MNSFEILHSLSHSTSVGSNKSSYNITKAWFYYKDNQLMRFSHVHTKINIMERNPRTFNREEVEKIYYKFFISNFKMFFKWN